MEVNNWAKELREYDTLTRLFATVPKHTRSSRFSNRLDLSWTNMDVSDKFIVIGTNAGVVFVYDRVKSAIQHELSYQEKHDTVSCVRLVSSLDESIAVGYISGVVVIYQLPSFTNGMRMRAMFVKDSHETPVVSLQWSLNAMKLFSGDSNGLVVCTEIDYDSFSSRSFLVCREPQPIVQLDYMHRTLLVSTLSRSFLCHLDQPNFAVQIGQTERKCAGKFGAVFLPCLNKTDKTLLFASRPGLRLWKANASGTVESTLLFRDQVTEMSSRTTLQRDVVLENLSAPTPDDRQFGCLLTYGSSSLVTYSSNGIYVIDHDLATVVCYHSNVGPIINIAVCGDEVFVLRNFSHRPLLRLSSRPPVEHNKLVIKETFIPRSLSRNNSPPPAVDATPAGDSLLSIRNLSLKAAKMKGGLVSALKEVDNKVRKLPVSSLIPAQFGSKPTERFLVGDDNDTLSDSKLSSHDALVKAYVDQAVVNDFLHDSSVGGLPVVSQYGDSRSASTQADSTVKNTASPQLDSDVIIDMVMSSCAVGAYSQHSKADVNNGSESARFDACSEPAPGLQERHVGDLAGDRRSSGSNDLGVPVSLTAPRVFSALPDEATSDIVFSSKRNAAKRTKKPPIAAKPKVNISKSTVSIRSSDSKSPRSLVNSPSAEFRQPVTNANKELPKNNHDAAKQLVLVKPLGLNIDLNLLRNDQPILDFMLKSASDLKVPLKIMPKSATDLKVPLKIQPPLPDKETSKMDVVQTQVDVKSNKSVSIHEEKIEEQQDKEAEVKNELKRLSSYEMDFYSRYRSNKSSPIAYLPETKTAHVSESEDDRNNRNKIQTNGALPLTDDERSKNRSFEISRCDRLTTFTESSSEWNSPNNNNGNKSDSSSAKILFDVHLPSSLLSGTLLSGTLVSGTLLSGTLVSGTLCYSMADQWVLMPAPANLQCISVSARYVWCVDVTGFVFYSALHGPGLQWFSIATITAQQMSVSPSGSLIWRLDGGSVYAASGVSARREPWGTKWVEVARDVAQISVDETVAWYVKAGGEVYMQKGLSRERPGYRALNIESSVEMSRVVCRAGVVWGLTVNGDIVVRVGIDGIKEEGTEWAPLKGLCRNPVVASMDLSDDGTAWVFDEVGRLWFTTDVSDTRPQGSGLWWQVSLVADQMNDPEAVMLLQQNSTLSGAGLVSAACNGIWICPRNKDVLHVSRESFVGHRWEVITPGGMWHGTKWKCVDPSSSLSAPSGAVWLVQSNGAIFCMASNASVLEVQPPDAQSVCVSLSARNGNLWCLLDNGHVYIRRGIHARCRQGVEWLRLNLLQLDQCCEKLIHVSIGSQSVWALSSSGVIYFRLGVVQPPPPHNPAWVAVVDDRKQPHVFSCVAVSPDDTLVWAIDKYHRVYARCGVVDGMLFGTHWSQVVSDCNMHQVVCSSSAVYSLDDTGQVYVRLGIEQENLTGSSWRKIPGALAKFAVTSDDEMWGISSEGELMQRHVLSLERKPVLEGLVRKDSPSEKWIDSEWVLV